MYVEGQGLGSENKWLAGLVFRARMAGLVCKVYTAGLICGVCMAGLVSRVCTNKIGLV